jgi:HAMP domain-containing protein
VWGLDDIQGRAVHLWLAVEALIRPHIEKLHQSSPEFKILATIGGIFAAYGLLRALRVAFILAMTLFGCGDYGSAAADARRRKRKSAAAKAAIDRPKVRHAFSKPIDADEAEEIAQEVNRMVAAHVAYEKAMAEAEEEKEKEKSREEQQREASAVSRSNESEGSTPLPQTRSNKSPENAFFSPSTAGGGLGYNTGETEDPEAARKRAEAKAQARLALLLDIAESSGLAPNDDFLQSIAKPLLHGAHQQ